MSDIKSIFRLVLNSSKGIVKYKMVSIGKDDVKWIKTLIASCAKTEPSELFKNYIADGMIEVNIFSKDSSF